MEGSEESNRCCLSALCWTTYIKTPLPRAKCFNPSFSRNTNDTEKFVKPHFTYFIYQLINLSGWQIFGPFDKIWKMSDINHFCLCENTCPSVVFATIQRYRRPHCLCVLVFFFTITRRGFIMGVWNSHTSVGNILGSLIAGVFVSSAWGMSFIVPGLIIASCGIVCFFFLVESQFSNI